MKITRIKILFTIFIFSAAVPSTMQVMRIVSVSAKDKATSKEQKITTTSSSGLSKEEFERRVQIVERLVQKVDLAKKELLAKLDKQELIEGFLEKHYLTSLEPKSVQKVCDALKALDVPDFVIEKILILGKDCKDHERYNFAWTDWVGCIPYAIVIDNEFLAKHSPFQQQFTFFHEGGHVKAASLGEAEDDNGELNEVIAEVYALAALTRMANKDNLKDLAERLHVASCSMERPGVYFNSQELVYYAGKFFAAQQRGEELDVPTYARKIVADRKKDGYEQEVEQGAKKLFDSTRDNADESSTRMVQKKK